MCLAIPGRVMEVTDEANRLALVAPVSGGDRLLVHAGTALTLLDPGAPA